MRKTSIFLVIALLFSFVFCHVAFAGNEFNIKINGKIIELKTLHTFKANRTMVTIDSGLFETLGAKVEYDKNNGKIIIDDEYSTVELTVNEPVAYIHKKFDFTGIPLTLEMDAVPFTEDNNVYVPLRFAVEGLGVQVDWDGISKSVLITTDPDRLMPVITPAEYKEISLNDIPEDLAKWVDANRMSPGIRFKTVDDKTYIQISAGEKPTGGYSIELESVTKISDGSIYITAKVIRPSPDMMVTQALTYPYILIVVEGEEIWKVDGSINDGNRNILLEEITVSSIGAAIFPEDITDITLYSLMGEKIKTYAPEEYGPIVEAFNNAKIDDSFYIMMLAGNRLTISLIGGASIEITSYGSETNIVASISSQEPENVVRSLHLVCPEIAQILLGIESK